MLQKIREAMFRRDSQYMLDGLIEIDDAFIGVVFLFISPDFFQNKPPCHLAVFSE